MKTRPSTAGRFRRALAATVIGALGVGAAVVTSTTALVAAPTASQAATSSALVLYDTTGPYGFLGEEYAMMTTNLASHFGTVTAKPVNTYTAGMMSAYTAVIYLGSTYDEPLPVAFLDDVLAGTKPVIWMFDNIWQLTNRQFAKTGQYWANVRGWDWTGFDTSAIGEVDYKGRALGRYSADLSGVMGVTINDPTKATAVAVAKRANGTTFPWATRSGNLTYIGEMPLSYISENNRYLAFSDLLFDALAPTTAERHRALVRIEDVSADSDPNELRAVADTLAAANVPFSVTVIPEYHDPTGVFNNGRRDVRSLWQVPTVVSALKYMVSKGGTLIMHGWTHQRDGIINPYNQVSGDDFEFFKAHVDPATNKVIFDGSIAGDSKAVAAGRINNGKIGFLLALLATPTIFTPPHYAASAVDYQAIKDAFKARYDRGLYFTGQLKGGAVSTTQFVGQFFPYPVTDIHGMRVIPENLGNEEPDAFNGNPPRNPADIIANAQANLVVRDGFASFFWHPYLVSDPRVGVAHLQQIVNGIKSLGYTFVASTTIANAATPATLLNPVQGFATPKSATRSVTGVLRPLGSSGWGGGTTTTTPAATTAPSTTTAPGVLPVTTVPNQPGARKPVEPDRSLGEQLVADPDPGPVTKVST